MSSLLKQAVTRLSRPPAAVRCGMRSTSTLFAPAATSAGLLGISGTAHTAGCPAASLPWRHNMHSLQAMLMTCFWDQGDHAISHGRCTYDGGLTWCLSLCLAAVCRARLCFCISVYLCCPGHACDYSAEI